MTHNDPIILQLEPDDDAITVRDRLTFMNTSRVILVWPPRAAVLQRKLDLRLIQRHASRQALALALVTSDPVVIAHARDLDLSVFKSVKAARRARWKMPPRPASVPPRSEAAQTDLAAIVSARRDAVYPARGSRWQRVARWGLFAAAIAVLLVGLFIAIPSATVTITPASDQIAQHIPIVAVPGLADVDIENYRIPAVVLPFEATSHVMIQSSGRETVGASQAQGSVTFTNTGDAPQLIPYGTVVATTETYPVRFQTTAEATLPGGDGATVEVSIQALPEHAGTAGNVSPGAIDRVEGPLAGVISVTNRNATYGGAIQEQAIVMPGDHERLLVLGRQQLLQNARDELLHQLDGNQFLVPGSVRIIEERPEWTIFHQFEGDRSESVTLDLRARVQAVVIDEQQARQVAYVGLAPFIRPGLEVSPNALNFRRGDIQNITPDGEVTFLMSVEGSIAVAIDENRVRDRVAGLSVSSALDRLQREFILDPARPPRISTWPGWLDRLPVLPLRIDVKVNTP